MSLPNGWRTGGYAALVTPVAVCACAGFAAVVAVGFLHPGASGPVDGPVLLPVAILVAGVCGLAAFLVLRASTDAMDMARTNRPLGIDDAARVVGSFLREGGVAHAEVPGHPSGRVFEIEGSRVRIEVEPVDEMLTWVLVGPVPEGDDPAFDALLAGLGDALDHLKGLGRKG